MSNQTVDAANRSQETSENPEVETEASVEEEQQANADMSAEEQQAAGDEVSDEPQEDQQNELEARVKELEEELSATNERLLRQAAELQNFRRRAEEEKTRIVASSKSRVLKPMLEVLDDLERSLEAAEQFDESEEKAEAAYQSLRDGVELVLRKFQGELERLGVEPIEAEGVLFDENEHEAMMQQPAPEDTAPGTVLQEIQKGYRLGERVLRHSKVIVAAGE